MMYLFLVLFLLCGIFINTMFVLCDWWVALIFFDLFYLGFLLKIASRIEAARERRRVRV